MTEARLVLGLCRVFGPGVLPSQVMAEDASVIGMAATEAQMRAAEGGE